MRSQPLLAALLLVAALAALVWWRPWETREPSPEPLVPGERNAPVPAVLEPGITAPRRPPALDPPHATLPDDPNAKARRAPLGPSTPTIPQVPESTGRLVGEVVDAEGKPVAGARITVHRLPTPEEARPAKQPGESQRNVVWVLLAGDVTTDANGRFEVAAPERTRLLVGVEPPTGLFWSGTVEGVDAPLRVELARAYEVKGRVLDAVTGAALANARVAVAGAPLGVPQDVRTDAAGAFRIDGLREGPVELRATAALMRSDSLGLDSEPIPEGIDVRASARVAAGTEGVELRVWWGLELAGTVETSTGGVPPPGVGIELYARSAQGQPDQRRGATARVGNDGKFRIDALPSGSYDLLFVPPAGLPDLASTWLRDVRPTAQDLRVVLQRGAVLAGRLVDESGKPVVARGGFVYVLEQGTEWGGVDSLYATLDGEGGFTTAALPATRLYDLLVRGFPGFAEARKKGVWPGRDDLVITLVSAREIHGIVLDPDGASVGAGVRVVAWTPTGVAEPGRTAATFTDAQGRFTLAGLTGDAYSLAAGGGGSAFAAGEPLLGIAPGGTTVEVRTLKGVVLSGRLVDPRGKAVQTQTLQASGAGGMAGVAWTRVDDREGRFLLTGLRTGRQRLGLYRDATYVDLGEFAAPAADVKVVVPDP